MLRTPVDPHWPLGIAAVLAGVLGTVTIWVVLAVRTDTACGWMALVAAVDHVLLLRLARVPRGPARALVAVFATLATAVAGAWMVVAAQLGTVVGLRPLASAMRLGTVLAWEYTRLGFGPWDWACVAFAPLLAAVLDSAQRRAPR
jgi:hypothetical protein